METLIEKYGVKKIGIIVGIFIAVLILLLVILKHTGGTSDKLLLSCDRSSTFENGNTFTSIINIFENSNGYKLNLHYDFTSPNIIDDENMLSFGENYISQSLDNIVNSTFVNSSEFVSKSYDISKNGYYFDIDVDITEDNNKLISTDLKFDLFNSSLGDIKSYFEEGGYVCSE